MIAIINIGMGNIKSVANAFSYLGAKFCLASDRKKIQLSDRLVFPGQGAFKYCMATLKSSGLFDVLNEEVLVRRKPFLGICLGMQILADCSYENGLHEGLGWIPGTVERLEVGQSLRLPHVGWNNVNIKSNGCHLFKGISSGTDFYFVHSYHLICKESEHLAAESEYGCKFVSAVFKENIFATQFHPEKSQANGLKILSNFARWNI